MFFDDNDRISDNPYKTLFGYLMTVGYSPPLTVSNTLTRFNNNLRLRFTVKV